MKFSKNWLQDHIENEIPEDSVFSDIISKKSFEIESVEKVNNDTIYDIKVLPNRQSDCLSHIGVAKEIATVFSLKKKDKDIIRPETESESLDLKVEVRDSKICPRYIGARVDNIKVTESPEWLKNKLESIGQRSISSIVDITNFILNDLGQPMHAFDRDKVKGGIKVHTAREGDIMTTLDGKELVMKGTETVIADDEGILALAGIKGGNRAEVDENTKSIIFESANFNSNLTRKTSDLHNIKTDASKRYEAGLTSELAEKAMDYALFLIKEMNPDCVLGRVEDVYVKKEKQFTLGVSVDEVNNLLGTSHKEEDIKNVLNSFGFSYKEIIPNDYLRELIQETLDKPYNRLASTLHDAPDTFSCGSLTNWLFVKCGYASPRVAIDLYFYTKHIEKSELKFGDLVFTNTGVQKPKDGMIYSQVLGQEIKDMPVYTETVEFMRGTKFEKGIDHVGMYVGEGKVLHTSSQIGKTVIEDLDKSEAFANECVYGRLVDDLSIKQFVVTIPFERLDLRLKVDLIEEIGRVLGYDNITSVLPKLEKKGLPHKRLYYSTKIKNILVENGFSEIITYTFGNSGDVEIVKGLASDKEKLRNNLGEGVLNALHMNLQNAPLLGEKTIKVFEFGNVFNKEGEEMNFAIGIDDGAKKSNFTENVEMILSQIKRDLNLENIEYHTVSPKPYVIELNFDKLIEKLPNAKNYEHLSQNKNDFNYKTVSSYPFIVRDIAFWANADTTWEHIHELVSKIDNPLLHSISLFDTFSKEIEGVKKISYAFRIVFQSYERTLTDDEVNVIADKYYNLLKEQGYEIR